MKWNRVEVLCWLFIIAAFGLAAGLYGSMPERVPTHWNARGVADGFSPKPWGPFLLPLLLLLMQGVFAILPRISPKGYRVEAFQEAYDAVRVSIMSFMFLISALASVAAVGVEVRMGTAVMAGLGLLFMLLGRPMGRIKRNFFVGIRTPWTLASDRVWEETHRLGGQVFMAAGAIMIVSTLIHGGIAVPIVTIVAAPAIPVIYSYVLYKRVEGFQPPPRG